MIEITKDGSSGVVAVRAVGLLTKAEGFAADRRDVAVAWAAVPAQVKGA